MLSKEIEEIKNHIEIAQELSKKDSKLAAASFKLILERSTALNYQEGISHAAYGLAYCYDEQDLPDKTIEYCSIALPHFLLLKNKEMEAKCYLKISKAYTTLGDNSKQAEYNFKGLELAIDIKDLSLQQKFYNNLSNYYHFTLKDMDKAIEYMNISTEISLSLKSYPTLLINYCNLGLLHHYRNEHDKALEYLHLAEETNTKYVNDDKMRCYYIAYIGTVYLGQGKDEIALKCFLEVVDVSRKKEYWIVFCEGAMMAGQAYGALGKYEEAIKVCNEGVEIAKEKNLIRLVIILYNVLSDLYEKNGDYEKALYYYEKHRVTRIQHASKLNEKSLEQIKFLSHLEESQKESEILKDRNSEMYRINELLIETDKEKNDFLGVVVHDLKNPLTNIILMAGNLKKNFERITPEKKISSLEKIYLSSERMLDIIDNLLDINKIESGNITLNMNEIKLKELTQRIISEFEIYSSQKNIKIILNTSGEAVLNSDEMVIKEILMNLISNALKYSHKDSEVNIDIAFGLNGKAEIKISDKGLGIKEEEKKKVFQKFAKISNKPTAGENSTGLGLSIVKKLTELCGGNIGFESEYGKGSTFILKF